MQRNSSPSPDWAGAEQAPGAAGSDAATPDSTLQVLAFPLRDPRQLPSTAKRPHAAPRRAFAIALGLLAFVVLATARSVALKTLLPLALFVAALLVAKKNWRKPSPLAPPRKSRAIALQGSRLELQSRDGSETAVLQSLELGDSFGVVMFSSRDRRKLLASVTSAAGTLLIGTRLESIEARRGFLARLSQSTLFAGDESVLDATGWDGENVGLESDAFAGLVDALEQRSPGCVGRLVLSDQRGEPVLLDGDILVARRARFDLARPLEWRPLLFQESFGQAITICQATWLRQGANEVVFVSLLPSSGHDGFGSENAATLPRTGLGDLDGRALRDQRLMQASAADPPPTDQRVALDGLFMVPLRQALDDAPRPSSQAGRSRHA